MNLIKHAIRSQFALGHSKPNHVFSFRQSLKLFSTGPEQPPPPRDSSVDPFLKNTGTGVVYAKLFGSTRHTLKTDIITLFEGCNLTPDDIKFIYNRFYMPLGVMIQFPSGNAYDTAFKAIGKRGRLYRLDRANRSDWDSLMPYDRKPAGHSPWDITHDGKTVLLQGIPINALPEDVERFLSGCQYDSSAIHLFQTAPTEKAALVRFHSRTEAMNALITKNRGFCLNGQISMRVLQ